MSESDRQEGCVKQLMNDTTIDQRSSSMINHWEEREGLWEKVSRDALEILKGSENNTS